MEYHSTPMIKISKTKSGNIFSIDTSNPEYKLRYASKS